jgi:hypothetical protein
MLQNGESSRRLKVAATVAKHAVVKPNKANAAKVLYAQKLQSGPPIIVDDEGGGCE